MGGFFSVLDGQRMERGSGPGFFSLLDAQRLEGDRPWIFLCSRWSAAGGGSGPGFFSVIDGDRLEGGGGVMMRVEKEK